MLQWHLDNLRGLGVSRTVICTGYLPDRIVAEIRAAAAENFVTTVFNPDYERGSVISLWRFADALCNGQDVLLMDADVLYDQRILERLIATQVANCFLLDREFEPGLEPVKLCIRDGVLVEFRKQLAADLAYELSGESVGFFRFSATMARRLAAKCQEYMEAGRLDEPCEEAIRDLLLESPEDFGYEDVTGLPWIEIDFPEDIVRAEREILPRIGKND